MMPEGIMSVRCKMGSIVLKKCCLQSHVDHVGLHDVSMERMASGHY